MSCFGFIPYLSLIIIDHFLSLANIDNHPNIVSIDRLVTLMVNFTYSSQGFHSNSRNTRIQEYKDKPITDNE